MVPSMGPSVPQPKHTYSGPNLPTCRAWPRPSSSLRTEPAPMPPPASPTQLLPVFQGPAQISPTPESRHALSLLWVPFTSRTRAEEMSSGAAGGSGGPTLKREGPWGSRAVFADLSTVRGICLGHGSNHIAPWLQPLTAPTLKSWKLRRPDGALQDLTSASVPSLVTHNLPPHPSLSGLSNGL